MNKLMCIDGFITGDRIPKYPLSLWETNIRHLGKLPFCQVFTLQYVAKSEHYSKTQNSVQTHKSSAKIISVIAGFCRGRP